MNMKYSSSGKCAELYRKLESERNSNVETGNECASLTLPYLMQDTDGFGQKEKKINIAIPFGFKFSI